MSADFNAGEAGGACAVVSRSRSTPDYANLAMPGNGAGAAGEGVAAYVKISPGPRGAAARSMRERLGTAHRVRIISAMAALTASRGVTSTTVSEVVSAAGVSRKTFYELFEDREDCMLAAIGHAFAQATECARDACEGIEPWADRMRCGLLALLQFFDDEPDLAWLCLVQSGAAGPAAFARRSEVLDELARAVDVGRRFARRQPPPLTAEGVVGGVLGVVSRCLASDDDEPLAHMVSPLMSVIVLPYLGNAAARRELFRPVRAVPRPPSRPSASDVLERLPMRVTHRTVAVLDAIAAEPGLSNYEVAERAGIADQGQISRLLSRLAHLGLTENTGGGHQLGVANAWHLTSRGREVDETIRRALPRFDTMEAGCAS